MRAWPGITAARAGPDRAQDRWGARQPRVRETAPLQVGDETPQQVVVRRGDDDDNVAQLGWVNRPYRPARSRRKSREGHDRHPHAGGSKLRGRARAARPQRRLWQHNASLRRELVEPQRIPVFGVVVNEWLG